MYERPSSRRTWAKFQALLTICCESVLMRFPIRPTAIQAEKVPGIPSLLAESIPHLQVEGVSWKKLRRRVQPRRTKCHGELAIPVRADSRAFRAKQAKGVSALSGTATT